jgi:hypothetical protein
MLDVHPPEHTPHTWRDFLIHIATIVVGLVIAIGLEQAVEAIHHHRQRTELREDLRIEARQRIQRLDENILSNANDLVWYRQILKAGREAQSSGDFVTFTIPRKKRMPYIADPPKAVWAAAKASGVVSVLPRDEIELWEAVDGEQFVTEHTGVDFNAREEALRSYFGIFERLGLPQAPGVQLRLTPKDRDLMMEAVTNMYESTWQLQRDDAYWKGSCQGILNGAKTPDDLVRYSLAALPK